MTDNILYHLPQQQQVYKPGSNNPPKGYEQQFQNPKYYKGNDWKTMNDPQSEQQSDTNSNLNYRQKELLKGEYARQQGEQQRKKDEKLRQKENDLQLQQQLRKEYDDDVLREKQQQAEKKRALAELYKAQIEQSQREKASKKQNQIEEDRYRLMQQDDGKRENNGRYVKEELRRDMVGQQYQADQRIKQEINRYQDQNVQPQFEIGGENYQKKQQMEKYERIQNINARNFVSYDDEKKRKADTFSNAGSVPAPYGGVQNKQYNEQMNAQYYEKNHEKREYNELLKRQMAENEQKKQQEKYDRLRGYEFDQVSSQNNRPQISQQQQQQQRPKQNDQDYDIMGNQKNLYSQQQKLGGENQKKEDQQRYRQILDMQREQTRITKMKEEQNYYQPPASQQQQYSNNPTRGKVQQDVEYDVMGNQRAVYGNSAQDNATRDQKKVDQIKYREMLDVQREQSKMAKQREDDDMIDLERKYNGLNIGKQPLEQNPRIYNPISNSYPYQGQINSQKQTDENKYQQQQYQRNMNSGKASQQRIDYSDLVNKNILAHNY
ncbi:kinase domain protein, putative (macronuclear) [Tetrahymena thermophila SB210]|uniref:Kinase domain protein, putative n=1 Tax=Tetrahymena thermophila (strain SB210) TaxID=312017 RepID=Q23FF1_TETTS|nr:kinase domain protein, putative [Tetrahymena thermophila SB210]EAR95202.3 kinase domain protein, putative [Tetrahymena thermophila SB210]|eukprot:XP_001015447.3 kinase domain protein, putative [Tetrahymena thermophila SB210]